MMALEHSQESRLGKNVEIHVPAAAEWFRIAGLEIEIMCEDETETINQGDLWLAQGGKDLCDSARLEFWKRRMVELGFGESVCNT